MLSEPLMAEAGTNTIHGDALSKSIYTSIYRVAGLPENEPLELVYVYSLKYNQYFDPIEEIIVGITNQRIFKLEYGNYTQQILRNIKSVSHEKNGFFRWDKIKCILHKKDDDCVDTFTIYHGVSCAYFCEYLAKKIEKNTPIYL